MSDLVPAGTIVVGLDGSHSSGRALGWAIDQAVLEHRPLTLAHAVVPEGAVWLDASGNDHRVGVETTRTEGHDLLNRAREEIDRRAPGLEVHEVLRVADPRDLLLALSEDAAMVVVGSRGRGPVRSLLLGSVGVAVTRHARCPVVVHRPGDPSRVRHGIVVGVDATPAARTTLEFAYRQASLRDLPLTVVHCYWSVGGPAAAEQVAADAQEQRLLLAETISGMAEKFPDVHVHTQVARGLVDDVLVRAGEETHLVVVGGHHGGAASEVLFGSVASSVVEHATCPVAVVPLTRF
ncbi:universal stress protein [Nocardioides sp. GCM10027113]|uniref:universal stress protein n=1 Tax=unclassified Nocardioides TaxID=2615069 RepID=UPI00360E134F